MSAQKNEGHLETSVPTMDKGHYWDEAPFENSQGLTHYTAMSDWENNDGFVEFVLFWHEHWGPVEVLNEWQAEEVSEWPQHSTAQHSDLSSGGRCFVRWPLGLTGPKQLRPSVFSFWKLDIMVYRDFWMDIVAVHKHLMGIFACKI